MNLPSHVDHKDISSLNRVLQLSEDDIQNLDVKKLQEVMMKSVFIIESSLFSQASMEHGRISEVRELLSRIEKSIDIDMLDDFQKVKYHSSVSKALSDSLNFLIRLHSSIAEGMEITNKMAERKEIEKTTKPSDNHSKIKEAEKRAILSEIRAELNRRVAEKSPF